MNNMDIEKYLNSVTKIVYDSQKRKIIRQELSDTIDDFTEMYIKSGLTKDDAIIAAIKQMGSPQETAQLFNQVYHVKYEWKIAIYIIVWSIAIRFSLYLLNASSHTAITANICWIVSLFFLFLWFFSIYCRKMFGFTNVLFMV